MTTLVKADWFNVDTDQQAQLIANSMAVPPEYFAEISCEGDRLFGVVTNCKRQTCRDTCETVLNGCARRTLWMTSFMVQQELEATLGWTLSPRYVTETLPWDGKSRIRLTFGGLEDLFMRESVTIVDEDVAYNPYVYSGLVVAGANPVVHEVLVPYEYLTMPEGVLFVDETKGTTFAVQEIDEYPQLRTVGPDKFWVLGIYDNTADIGDTVNVMDCLWGYVDAPDVECTDEVAIVYQDSVQKIPVEKVTDDRWYIKHRNMVRQVYQGDTVDLTKFQTHKLYDVVDVGCFGETCELVTIYKKCSGTVTDCGCDDDATPCEVVEVDACATVVDAKSGIIEVQEVEVITDDNGDPVLGSDGCPTFRQKSDCTDDCLYTPYQVTVSYRTNPVQSGISNTSAVETLRSAIAARVAAEVPLVDCGCDVECGYFKEMRVETNTQTYTQGGAIVVALRYGNKIGQQKYAKALETVPRNRIVGLA